MSCGGGGFGPSVEPCSAGGGSSPPSEVASTSTRAMRPMQRTLVTIGSHLGAPEDAAAAVAAGWASVVGVSEAGLGLVTVTPCYRLDAR